MTSPLFAAVVEPPLWPLVAPLALGAAAIYLLLPHPRAQFRWVGAALGGLSLGLAGYLLVHFGTLTAETFLFYVFSGLALLGAGATISQANPAYAALSFAVVVLSTCGLFLLQAAPFLMASTVIIYAGAVIVTFLFVLMLAQRHGPSDADDRSREPLLATMASFILLGALLATLRMQYAPDALVKYMERARTAAAKDSPDDIVKVMDPNYFRELESDLTVLLRHGEEDRGEGEEEATALPELKAFRDSLLNDAYEPKELWEKGRNKLVEANHRWDNGLSLWQHGKTVPEEEGRKSEEVSFFAARLRGSVDMKLSQELGRDAGPPMRQALPQLLKDLDRLYAATGGQPPPALTPNGTGELPLSKYSGPPPNGPIVRDGRGEAVLPAENVAGIGRTLFTDYLLAVELAGTLLLAATIGSIIIAVRSGERHP